MTQEIHVTYYITDDGWIYTESFGTAELEGRVGTDVGVEMIDGVRTLCIPEQVDGIDVYTLSFRGFDKGFEALYVPDSVGIILPHAFAGCRELKTVRVPEDMYDIAETAFEGTSVPEERQKELYAMGRMKREMAEQPDGTAEIHYPDLLERIGAAEDEIKEPEEPGNDIPF